jgi:anaerobic magnesium-protoporphyrin IX monomethyl ester cyclase
MGVSALRRRVVLYNPPSVFWTMPLALIAVGSAIDRSRYEVTIVDGRLEADPIGTLLARLDDSTVCLGVTVLTGAPIRDALAATRAVKRANPRVPIVWGGWHPSLFPEQCLLEADLDAVVVGQGEETFADLVERWGHGQALDGTPGCVYRQGAEAVRGPPRPLRDVNDFPPHNFDLVEVEKYYTLKRRRQMDYISSQGCRFRCTFCADPFVYKRGWSGLSPERMGVELGDLWTRYPFDDLSFQDETFFTNSQRVQAVSDEILRRGLKFTWAATMRADQGVRLDEAILADCKRSGLRRAMVGVESGSQAMLDWMKKDIKLEQVFETAERLVRHDIGGLFPFIVGFPDETPESVAATLEVIKRLRAMSPKFESVIYFYQPYPGSPIADLAWKRGYPQPRTLDEWAEFDYVGARGPWVTQPKWDLIQRFNFYEHHAFGPNRHWARRPLRWLARVRIAADFYYWPFEKYLADRLVPRQKLS